MILQNVDFGGGINTHKEAHLIAQNEAVFSTNTKVTSGSIESIKEPAVVQTISGSQCFYYEAKDEIVSSSEDRFYVEYNGYLYWSNKDGVMKRYDGVTVNNIGGWVAPTIDPTVAVNIALGFLDGDYTYCYTYLYDNTFESPPSGFKAIAPAKQKIDVTFTDTPPAGAIMFQT